MRTVSELYKQEINKPFRNRGYMKVYLGAIKQDAQSQAKIQAEKMAYIADDSNIFNSGTQEKNSYVTFEKGYNTVTGEMKFPTEKQFNYKHIKTGIVSDELLTNKAYRITITSEVPEFNLKGVTLDFGENYPIEFKVIAGNDILHIKNNDKALFRSEKVFNHIKNGKIEIIFLKMKNDYCRARLYHFTYGFGLTLTNNEITASRLSSYVSPICKDLPQIDFRVTIDNKNKYFNVDDPNSVVNFLEYGQHLNVSYGYDIGEKIEWINKAELVCKGWKSDDKKAVLEAEDMLRERKESYTRIIKDKIDCYTLTEEIIKALGYKKYYIDSYLKDKYTTNSIVNLPIKQALQLVANLGKATICFDFDRGLVIKSAYEPKLSISGKNAETYSNIDNVLTDKAITEFANSSPDYTIIATNGMRFFDNDYSKRQDTGFISVLSDDKGKFSNAPKLRLSLNRSYQYYGLIFDFGHSLPKEIRLRTYKEKKEVETLRITQNITKHMNFNHAFSEFDIIDIEFLSTEKPFNRIVVNRLKLGDISDFKMRRNDMTNSPLAIKQDLIKTIDVAYYKPFIDPKATAENYFEEEVDPNEYEGGYSKLLAMNDDYYDYEFEADGKKADGDGIRLMTVAGKLFILAIFGTVFDSFNDKTKWHKFNVTVKAKKKKIQELFVKTELYPRGKVITWKNPLISDEKTALEIGQWLKEYYSSGVEYEYKYRGNPELDSNDIIYQENEWNERMQVNAYKTELEFGNAFRGKVWTRYIKKDEKEL